MSYPNYPPTSDQRQSGYQPQQPALRFPRPPPPPNNNFNQRLPSHSFPSDQRPPYQHQQVQPSQNAFPQPPQVPGNFRPPFPPQPPIHMPPSNNNKEVNMNLKQNNSYPQIIGNTRNQHNTSSNDYKYQNPSATPNMHQQQHRPWSNVNQNEQRPPLEGIRRTGFNQPRFIPSPTTNMPNNAFGPPRPPQPLPPKVSDLRAPFPPRPPPGDFISRPIIPMPNENIRFPLAANQFNPQKQRVVTQFFPPPVLNNNQNAPRAFLPPPVLLTSTDPVPVEDSRDEYTQVMVDIVQKWLTSRNITKSNESKDDGLMRLQEFRENLYLFVELIEKLRSLNDSLAENMEAEKDAWETLMQDVMKTKVSLISYMSRPLDESVLSALDGKKSFVKNLFADKEPFLTVLIDEVIDLQFKLFNPQQTKFITSLQKERRKKRERIRRKRRKCNENYVASLSKRIQLNEKIDEALQKERTKIAMEKRDESLKNTAGESLVEVKHKQTQVSKFIEVLRLLSELREIRKKTAIYQGIFVTEKDDEKFHSKVESASELLKANAKIYQSEEWALRTLREEEAQEMNRVEKEKRKMRKENREEQLTKVDPMFPFRLFWRQGEDSIAGLVHVRRMWDIFLCPPNTPGGSRIPKTLVEPSKPSNRDWARYLVKKAKVRKRKSDFGGASSSKD